MQQEQSPELPDELKDFAQQLTSFKAHTSTVNRDQLFFQAGQLSARTELLAMRSSVRRTLRIWQLAALVLFAFSLGLGTSLALRHEQLSRVLIVERDRPLDDSDKTSTQNLDQVSMNELISSAAASAQERLGFENSASSDLAMSDQHVIEALHSRLTLVEQMIEVISNPDRVLTTSEGPLTLAHQRIREPALTHRSLLQGEGSRILINRLIEEPSL